MKTFTSNQSPPFPSLSLPFSTAADSLLEEWAEHRQSGQLKDLPIEAIGPLIFVIENYLKSYYKNTPIADIPCVDHEYFNWLGQKEDQEPSKEFFEWHEFALNAVTERALQRRLPF